MIRVTFELLPGGVESRARKIGLMEITNVKMNEDGTADYAVILTKTPPFSGALRAAWKRGLVSTDDNIVNGIMQFEDEEIVTAFVGSHHRTKRGVYDLFYRALAACGLDRRNVS